LATESDPRAAFSDRRQTPSKTQDIAGGTEIIPPRNEIISARTLESRTDDFRSPRRHDITQPLPDVIQRLDDVSQPQPFQMLTGNLESLVRNFQSLAENDRIPRTNDVIFARNDMGFPGEKRGFRPKMAGFWPVSFDGRLAPVNLEASVSPHH
jgi:hypothetical protein